MSGAHDHHDSDALAISAQDDYYHNARERSIEDNMLEEYSEKPPPPPKKKFYKNKKYWIICSIISAIVIIVVVCLIVFVFFPMIVQSLMNQAGIDVNGADISFSPPQQQQQPAKRDYDIQKTFYMSMKSSLKNTGPFSANIVFHNPILVYYNGTLLGNITLPDTSIGGGHGDLNAETPFLIEDPNFFASFSKDMLALDNFDWNLKGSCDVTALSRTSTANLDKTVTIPGMGGFKDVKIQSFNLPANDPTGGILVELGTVMKSPSPIGIQLGTIQLNIGYQGVNLGMVSASNVTLVKGDNTIPLKGSIKPLTNPADLEKVGVMFSTYVSGGTAQTSATGVSAAPDGHTPINWLTEAFKSVQMNVGLSNQGGPLKIINAVSMGYLDLKFDANNPYSPTVSAPNVVADFSIPFGFTLNITDVTQNITMNTNSTGNFSELIVPWVKAQSDQQAGKLQFPITNAVLAALPGKNDAFNSYTYDLTSSDLYTFGVSGQATTKTLTPIGEITLGGITFAVPTALHGLQFLNSTPTVINSVDMMGGTSEALQLDIGVTMGNPSDFSMSVGDVTFAMFAEATQVGTVTLANLTLQRGDNTVIAKANFDPKSSQQGQGMLTAFVMGQNSSAAIGGFENSTAIASLVKALSAVKIDTTLPGLKEPLIQSGALTVLPDTVQTSIVNVAVTIKNPFTAGLAITKVKSAATYKGMPVGNIDQDISSNPFVISGHANGVSPQLNMQMNLEPAAVALLMRDLAVDANLDTKALDSLLGMGGFHIQGQEDVTPSASVFDGFNISSYVLQAMKALKADLALESTLQVGDYVDVLSFSQNAVQINADDTVTRLIPIVGQPIVQQIVNGAELGFETLILSDPTNNNAKVQMKGSITKTGPMAATINFPSPLTVRWQGRTLGTATMPAIQALADKGAQFDVPSTLVITDQDAMQDFATYMINNEDFVWDIVSDDVAVTALGFTFTGIKMEKFVTLKGANGFKGAVTINQFNLPSNEPNNDGITLIADTTIVNPSQVGFNLNTVAFNSYYKDVLVGPLGASPGNFAPAASSKIQMKGKMIPQKTQHGLDMITEVFENYLAAKNSILSVQGDYASGPAGQVGWLTQAFKSLKIENVILPGPPEKPVLIPSITMMNMQLDFTKDPYAAPASSTEVRAQLKNPFGFPLGVTKLSMEVDAQAANHKMAHLSVPTQSATTDNTGMVKTQFSNVPFKVYGDSHDLFSGFLMSLTQASSAAFGLAGVSNALTQTAVGNLQLDGISFDVTTTMAGLGNLGGKTDILSLVIAGGTKDYVLVKTVVAFTNPSQITISVGDINFSAKTTDGTYTVGQVFIKDTIIKPGVNQYNAEFHLAGPSAVIGHLFTNYLTNVQMPLSIVGTPESTAIEPLKKALGSVKLATTMNGIQANLIVSVKVIIKVDELLAGKSTSVATLKNPFETPYVLNGLKADVYFPSTISGTFKVGHVDSIPGPCTIPAGGTASCDPWTVIMDAGLDKLIEILVADEKVLNMQQNISCLVGGSDGYSSEFYYAQDRVPTEVEFDAGLFAIPLSPKVNTTESANTTSTASTSVPVPSSSSTTDKPTEAPITTTTAPEQSTETPTKSSEATPKATTESKSEPTASAAVKDSHFIFPF
ncbi:hypothetical protein [Absidia glauca]|uniref:Tag1-like fourth Ig-like domain-containing protein n=1 Tax=Absidia glauca TaxID=4829 RepID=A0A163JWJ1_ABSGL|nr:hypothetical protein [Absidia glauca]